MKITKIKAWVLRYPLAVPLRPSWAPGRVFNFTTCTALEVHTDEGWVGTGASPDTGQIGLHTLADLVAPYLLGKDPFATEQLSPFLRNAARDGSYPWGVETALWDLIGKVCQQPTYRLWGAFRQSLPVYASLAELVEPDQQIERLWALYQQGFRAFKLRLRRPDIRQDIALVEKVRSAMSADVQLMVDANQAHTMPSPGPHKYWTFDEALTVARAMQDLGVLWVEEPLHRYNLKQLAKLCEAVDIPIAGGELNLGLHEYKALIDQDSYDIIQADCAFSEGVFQLRKIAALAELSYKKFIPHTWSNGIGLAANLHLALSVPNCDWFEYPIDPPAWTSPARDFMLLEDFPINPDGTITVGNQPGMGITLDPAALERYAVYRWESD